jgi:hypothetical protein
MWCVTSRPRQALPVSVVAGMPGCAFRCAMTDVGVLSCLRRTGAVESDQHRVAEPEVPSPGRVNRAG